MQHSPHTHLIPSYSSTFYYQHLPERFNVCRNKEVYQTRREMRERWLQSESDKKRNEGKVTIIRVHDTCMHVLHMHMNVTSQ